jgi:molybdopterin-guanine dinucleotide biosynthesis protein A
MLAFEGFILTGGESRRMGVDKCDLLLGELTFAERGAAALTAIARSITAVGRAAGGLPAVPDVRAQWGALGGLHTALTHCRAEWAAVLACDLPFVSGELWLRLAARRTGAAAVAPIQNDGRVQPLCAIYRVDPCLVVATELIDAGERRPLSLLQRVSARLVPFAELADLDDSDRFFANINTPSDYSEARREEATG